MKKTIDIKGILDLENNFEIAERLEKPLAREIVRAGISESDFENLVECILAGGGFDWEDEAKSLELDSPEEALLETVRLYVQNSEVYEDVESALLDYAMDSDMVAAAGLDPDDEDDLRAVLMNIAGCEDVVFTEEGGVILVNK